MGTTLKDLKYLLETILECEREEGGNHTKYIFRVNNRVVAFTFYSRSWRNSKQIDASILSQQAKEMKCSTMLWKKLLIGQASKNDYLKELLNNGHISYEEHIALSK